MDNKDELPNWDQTKPAPKSYFYHLDKGITNISNRMKRLWDGQISMEGVLSSMETSVDLRFQELKDTVEKNPTILDFK